MLENALGWLRYPIIVIPIVTAILLAYYNKFRPANKWILLRGSAEAIKREIYRYRCRSRGITAKTVSPPTHATMCFTSGWNQLAGA